MNISLLIMKSKFFLLAALLVGMYQFGWANNQLPTQNDDPFAGLPSVISYVNDPAVADALAPRADTTITIYGSGGMNNNSGTVCPTTATTTCAKIEIKGLAVSGSSGDLYWDRYRIPVEILTIKNVNYEAMGGPSVQGQDLSFRLR